MIWSPAAERDLQHIRDYIGERNPAAAERVANAIKAAAAGLAAFPYKGHAAQDATREWIVPEYRAYLLIYDVDRQAVSVLRVWDQHRDR